jgi:hypothetical protein
LSEGQDGDTVDEGRRLSSVKNLDRSWSLDVTDTTLATDLVGQGDAVRDGLGVTRGTIAGLRDKGEDVLNKDVVGCDSVVDLDAYLEERSPARAAGVTKLLSSSQI